MTLTIDRCDSDNACDYDGCTNRTVASIKSDDGKVIYVCGDHLGPTPAASQALAMALCIPPPRSIEDKKWTFDDWAEAQRRATEYDF